MTPEKKNHGIVNERASASTTIRTAYGKDDSDVTGSADKERNPHSMGGSTTNLSHSITSGSANLKGA